MQILGHLRSSRKMRDGLAVNSTPMETLLFSPPDIPLRNLPPINVSAQDSNPNFIRVRSATSRQSSSFMDFGRRNRALKRSASRGVDVSCKASSCATYAIILRCSRTRGLKGSAPRYICPSTWSLELVGTRPANVWKRLVSFCLEAKKKRPKRDMTRADVGQTISQYKTKKSQLNVLPAPEAPIIAVVLPASALPHAFYGRRMCQLKKRDK